MKKILNILIVCMFMMLITPMNIHAQSDTDFTYTTLEDGTLEITAYNGNSSEIVIPSELDGKTVTVIGEDVFKDHTEITAVTIPDSIIEIRDGAFVNCTNLAHVNMTSPVTADEEGTFAGCPNLDKEEVIGAYSFVEDDGENIELATKSKDHEVDESIKLYNETIEGDLIIRKGAKVTLTGTSSIGGNIYVYGTLINESSLTLGGKIYCLKYGEKQAVDEEENPYEYGDLFDYTETITDEMVVVDAEWLNEPHDPVIEPDLNILMVGNSYTYRESCGYGFYSILKEMAKVNEKYVFVDGSTNQGISLKTLANTESYLNKYKSKINEKKYDVIVMQGPTNSSESGVTGMKDACKKLVNLIQTSTSKGAKVYFVATHGHDQSSTLSYLNDKETAGMSEGWKSVTSYLNQYGYDTDYVDGGIFATIYQTVTGKKVICGSKYNNKYDNHPSWLGSYAMTAALYAKIFNENPTVGLNYEDTVDLDMADKSSFKSVVGVGYGNYVSIPTVKDTEIINGMLDGCAAFYEPQMTQYLVDGSCSNGLFIYPSGKAVYDSSDPAVASVSSASKVTFHAIGSTDIIAKINGTQVENLTASYNLTVKPKNVTKARWEIPSYQVTYGTKPFANKSLVISSSGQCTYFGNNSKVVSVDQNIGTMTFKGIGTATITAKVAETAYSTSAQASFTLTVVPKGTYISSFTKYSKGFKVRWKKQTSKTNGYQIRYSLYPNMSGAKSTTISKNSTTSTKITKLKKKTYYYVQIRTYGKVGSKKYYSDWSAVKKVKTK